MNLFVNFNKKRKINKKSKNNIYLNVVYFYL